jgi:hypothetical protein
MSAIDFLVQLPFSWRQRCVRAVREDMNRQQFVAALAENDLEERAAALLWEKLVEAAVVADFRPSPDDDLLRVYGLADEDLDEDIILAILIELEIGVPCPPVLERVGEIKTPRDVIQLVRLASGPSGR